MIWEMDFGCCIAFIFSLNLQIEKVFMCKSWIFTVLLLYLKEQITQK